MAWLKLSLILVASMLLCFGIQAEEPDEKEDKNKLTKEQILADPYFRTLLQIGLKKDQTKQFKQLIDDYAYQRGKAIIRAKRSYSGNLESAIKRAHRKIISRFVTKVDKLLDDDQFQRFAAFHLMLDERLKGDEGLDEDLHSRGGFE